MHESGDVEPLIGRDNEEHRNAIFSLTNATTLENVPEWEFQPLTLPYLRSTANTLVEGPKMVLLRHVEADRKLAFEQIYRLLIRVPNQRQEAWSVFRRGREWSETPENEAGCILRHAIWHTTIDHNGRTWEKGAGPTVSLATYYVTEAQSTVLAYPFEALDKTLISGVRLSRRRRSATPEWLEVSILRHLNWGLLDLTWNEERECRRCEAAAFDLASTVERVLNDASTGSTRVYGLRAVYPPTPYLVLSSEKQPASPWIYYSGPEKLDS